MSRKFFIDAGGNNGCSVRHFRKNHDKDKSFRIITFEPRSAWNNKYEGFKNHELINKAVWNEDGTMDFLVDKRKGSGGSTLIAEKNSGKLDRKNPSKVETVRLSTFISSNTEENDLIYLKLDIEGAEYVVLEDLIETGVINRVDKLFIEWHSRKLKGNDWSSREKKIKNHLKEIGLEWELWNALKS